MHQITMVLHNQVTGKTDTRDLPHLYGTRAAAYRAIDFFESMGGEWSDHDNLDSEEIHVSYCVTVPDFGGN